MTPLIVLPNDKRHASLYLKPATPGPCYYIRISTPSKYLGDADTKFLGIHPEDGYCAWIEPTDYHNSEFKIPTISKEFTFEPCISLKLSDYYSDRTLDLTPHCAESCWKIEDNHNCIIPMYDIGDGTGYFYLLSINSIYRLPIGLVAFCYYGSQLYSTVPEDNTRLWAIGHQSFRDSVLALGLHTVSNLTDFDTYSKYANRVYEYMERRKYHYYYDELETPSRCTIHYSELQILKDNSNRTIAIRYAPGYDAYSRFIPLSAKHLNSYFINQVSEHTEFYLTDWAETGYTPYYCLLGKRYRFIANNGELLNPASIFLLQRLVSDLRKNERYIHTAVHICSEELFSHIDTYSTLLHFDKFFPKVSFCMKDVLEYILCLGTTDYGGCHVGLNGSVLNLDGSSDKCSTQEFIQSRFNKWNKKLHENLSNAVVKGV